MRDHTASKHRWKKSFKHNLILKDPRPSSTFIHTGFHGSHIGGVYLGTVPLQRLESRCLKQKGEGCGRDRRERGKKHQIIC